MNSTVVQDWVDVDGAYGEGGGQILRTALTLSVITGRPLRIERIRPHRRNPGLAAQHLTAGRSAAALCSARLTGDTLGSMHLEFAPTAPVAAENYDFDVALAREGGSAGAVTLVLQTVLLPLARAPAESDFELRGGTHMAWSPPFDYVRDVWLTALARLGVDASLDLAAWGWYPVGGGEIRARIQGGATILTPLDIEHPGPLLRVVGRAVAANLPAHIPQRMVDRARSLLAGLGVELRIEPLRVRAACAGAGIFVTAEYANLNCGFSALGAVGKPSEQVAEEAAEALLRHHRSGAALDLHLGDQNSSAIVFCRWSVALFCRRAYSSFRDECMGYRTLRCGAHRDRAHDFRHWTRHRRANAAGRRLTDGGTGRWRLGQRRLPAVFAAHSDQAGFDAHKGQRRAPVLGKIDAEGRRDRQNDRQRRRVCLGPGRPQFAQKDVRRNRAHAIEGKEAGFEIGFVAGGLMQPPQAALILVDERSAVAQYLIGFAEVIPNIPSFAHDRIDEEIPPGVENGARGGQMVSAERLIGPARDRLADVTAKQQAREKPAKILVIVIGREIDAQLFRIKKAVFQLRQVSHR